MTDLEKLQLKFTQFTRKGDYINAMKISKRIEAEKASREQCTLKSLTDTMSAEDKYKTVTAMHRLIFTADILYGYAVDFQSVMKELQGNIDVAIVMKAMEAVKLLRSITRNVDIACDKEAQEDFGATCDELGVVIEKFMAKRDKQLKKNLKVKSKKKEK